MEEESLPLMTQDIRVDLFRVTLSFQDLISWYDKRTQQEDNWLPLHAAALYGVALAAARLAGHRKSCEHELEKNLLFAKVAIQDVVDYMRGQRRDKEKERDLFDEVLTAVDALLLATAKCVGVKIHRLPITSS
jgi:Asp-tRNA(Asn)/Glu-tRNA(Gln) amidotransferase A subunit family amidase